MAICGRQHKQRASRCCKIERNLIQIHVPSEEPKDGSGRCLITRRLGRQREVPHSIATAFPRKS
jgi:hypothetical protein